MSDYIERDKAIEAIAEHLMGEAVFEYPDASDNIEDWKEIGEAILESIPPAEVIPKGSDEASLAYAEGWKNGEEAERSRHKIAMSDYIKRKSIRNMYSCLNPDDRVRAEQVVTDIDAIPSADAVSLEEFEQMRFLADKSMEMVGESTWTSVLTELHEQFSALEKEIRKASAEMSAIIREHVDKDINVRSKDESQTSCKTCHYGEVDEGYVRCAYYSKSAEQDEPQLVKDLVKAFCEDGTWLERQGVYTLTLAEAKQRAVDIIESVMAKDEQTERSE